jgi:hypothetical protein
MITLNVIFLIVWLHFIGDFVLQSTKMAKNKWNSLYWLGIHCCVYGIPFLYFGVRFALITIGFHFIVDFLTSKATHHLWEKKELHWFFVVIGWDQALHFSCLFLTWNYLFGGGIL